MQTAVQIKTKLSTLRNSLIINAVQTNSVECRQIVQLKNIAVRVKHQSINRSLGISLDSNNKGYDFLTPSMRHYIVCIEYQRVT